MARPRLELLARHAALLFIARVTKDLFAHRFHRFTRIRKRRTHSQNLLNLRSLWRTLYEENRHSFWSRAQFSAGVCRAGESENRRQRYFRGVRQNRQGDPGRAVWLRRGDRPHLAGCAVLSRLAQECCAHRHGGGEQSILVERRREIFQQCARDQNRRGGPAHRTLAVESAATGHERQIISQPDRKSTRLNSSHITISYAVFCLTKTTDPVPEVGESHYLRCGSAQIAAMYLLPMALAHTSRLGKHGA